MLTDTKIRASKPAEKSYKLSDAHQLYLLVTPEGGKLWRMNYTFGRNQRALAFDPYPFIGLAKARQMRDDARLYLAKGAILRRQDNSKPSRMLSALRPHLKWSR